MGSCVSGKLFSLLVQQPARKLRQENWEVSVKLLKVTEIWEHRRITRISGIHLEFKWERSIIGWKTEKTGRIYGPNYHQKYRHHLVESSWSLKTISWSDSVEQMRRRKPGQESLCPQFDQQRNVSPQLYLRVREEKKTETFFIFILKKKHIGGYPRFILRRHLTHLTKEGMFILFCTLVFFFKSLTCSSTHPTTLWSEASS